MPIDGGKLLEGLKGVGMKIWRNRSSAVGLIHIYVFTPEYCIPFPSLFYPYYLSGFSSLYFGSVCHSRGQVSNGMSQPLFQEQGFMLLVLEKKRNK